MSSLNEALEFREAICQEEIRYLKEKISALEGKEKRFGLVETRVNELEEENTNLRHSLGKEREKVKKLSEEEEKTRLKELRFLSAESDAKSDIYRLETTNQSLENKLSHQQTLVCSLTSQNELQANNLAEFTRTKTRKVEQLVEQLSRLESQNALLVLERDRAFDKWTRVKEASRQKNLKLEESLQELAQTQSYCNQLESQCQANLDNFTSCSDEYKATLFEKSITIQSLEKANSKLKEKTAHLQNEVNEQRELATAQLVNVTGTSSDSSSPLLFYIQEYKKLGRYPEQIYKEFFEIREKYTQLQETYSDASLMTSRLENEIKDKNVLLKRFHEQLDVFKSETQKYKEEYTASELELKCLTKKLEQVETDHITMATEKKSLEISLQDTSYQLQYLIYDVYKRQDPIPVPVKKASQTLTVGLTLKPNLIHDDLVFRNVSELQNLNRKLSEKTRILENQITTFKSNSAFHEKQSLDKELAKFREQLKHTEVQLNEKQKEIENLQQELVCQSTNAKDGHDVAFASLLTEFRTVNDAFNQYRASTSSDLNQLEFDLKISNQRNQELQNTLRLLQEKAGSYKNDLERVEDLLQKMTIDLDKARQESVSAYNDRELQSAKLSDVSKELVDYKHNLNLLKTENISLKSQLQAQVDTCNAIQKEKTEYNVERVRLSNILESINLRIKDNESVLADEVQMYRVKSIELSGQLKYAEDTIKTLEKDLERIKHIQLPAAEAQFKKSQAEATVLKEKLLEYKVQESEKSEDAAPKARDFVPIQSSCEEHSQLISELKAKVTALEEANEEYIVHVEDVRKKYSDVVLEQRKYVEEKDKYIQKINSALKDQTQSLVTSQKIAEKAKEEYSIMCDSLKAAQEKLLSENKAIESENKELNGCKAALESTIEKLTLSVEEQKIAFVNLEEKAKESANTIKKLQEDLVNSNALVAQLENQLSENKQKLQDALNDLTSDKERYNDEVNMWACFQDDINKYRLESEKSNSRITDRLDQLIDIWTNPEQNADTSNLTDEMIALIRQHNAVATFKKETSDARYLEAYQKCKMLEQEVHRVKVNLNVAQDIINELRGCKHTEENQDALKDALIYDAYKLQNQELVNNNKLIKKNAEEVTQAAEKLRKELGLLKHQNIQLENELSSEREEKAFLLDYKEKWSTRSATTILKAESADSAEIETIKALSNQRKLKIETLEAEVNTMSQTVESWKAKAKALQEELESSHSNQATIIANSNQKQRFAIELKNRLNDANKKVADYEVEVQRLKEANSAASESHNQKSVEETLKKEQESKHALEENLKVAESSLKATELSLKKKTDEFTSLKNQHTSLLNRARTINSEKIKMIDDIKALKAELESCQKSKKENNLQVGSSEKTNEYEAEIRRLENLLKEAELDNQRLLVKSSLSSNKVQKLQEELNLLKSSETIDADKQQSLKAGFKRDRDDKEDSSASSPKKK